MGRDDKRVADSREVVKGKQQADARLSCPSMVEFDLTQVVVSQEKTPSCRCRDSDHVAFPLGDQTGERRIVLENKIHLALEAAGEALPAATQCGALCANVMKNAIGKREKYFW